MSIIKQQTPHESYDEEIKDLNAEFKKLIHMLDGSKNSNKAGTLRHRFETDFSYALHELKNCPAYIKSKRFEQAVSIVNSLKMQLKKEEKTN